MWQYFVIGKISSKFDNRYEQNKIIKILDFSSGKIFLQFGVFPSRDRNISQVIHSISHSIDAILSLNYSRICNYRRTIYQPAIRTQLPLNRHLLTLTFTLQSTTGKFKNKDKNTTTVPDQGYYRNTQYALNLISTFLLLHVILLYTVHIPVYMVDFVFLLDLFDCCFHSC